METEVPARPESKQVNWCFTPSQPVRLYQGEQGQKEVLQKERTKTVVLPTPIRIGVNGQVLKEQSHFSIISGFRS